MTLTVSRTIRFEATLLRCAGAQKNVTWSFLALPLEASAQLPTRSMVTVEGTINDHPFQATLNPDGKRSHWLKISKQLRVAAGAEPGDRLVLAIAPVAEEPEPKVPPDLRKALAAAPAARDVWDDLTAVARRDWIHWITSAKRPETRARRIANGCDMLASGKRRVCCFDRSGIYSKSLGAPEAADLIMG